jgi:hypothetical protein
MYSNGASEEIIGKAIKKYEIPRHKLVILTKCFSTVAETPDQQIMNYTKEIGISKDYVNQNGMSPFLLLYGIGPDHMEQAYPAKPSSTKSRPPLSASTRTTSISSRSTASTPTRRWRRPWRR